MSILTHDQEVFGGRCRAMDRIIARLRHVIARDQEATDVPPHEPALQQTELALLEQRARTAGVRSSDAGHGINLADFGARGDGVADDSAAWRAALAALQHAGPGGVLTIPRGCYRLSKDHRPFHLELIGLEDVTLEAEPGTTLLMADIGGGILLRESRNVTVRGLTIDFVQSPFSIGRVVRVEPDRAAVVWRVKPNQDPPTADRFARSRLMRGVGFDPDTGEVAPGVDMRIRSVEPMVDRCYRLQVMSNAGDIDPQLLTRVRPGMILPLSACGHPESKPGVSLHHCCDVLLEDVVIHASYLHAFFGLANDGLVFHRCACEPNADRGHIVSNPSDAFHMRSNRFGPVFEACRVRHCYDDAINAYGQAHSVLTVQADHTVLLGRTPLAETSIAPTWQIGDLVAFYNPNSNRIDATTRIAAISKGSWQGDDWLGLKLEHTPVSLVSRESLDLGPVGYREFVWSDSARRYEHFVINLQTKSDGLVVRGCTLAPARSGGLKLKASNAIIEDNDFHSPGFPLQVCMRMTWQEAYAPRNVIIRRNRFHAGGIMLDCTSPRGPVASLPLIRHVEISENELCAATGMPVVSATEADRVRIAHNRFAGSDWISIQRCGQIGIESNQPVERDATPLAGNNQGTQ